MGNLDDTEADEMTVIRNDMINHLLHNPEIVFKSQQIGEPELTAQEKRDIVEECLKNKPLNFLARFSQYMLEPHFQYLKLTYPECAYEVGHYIQENSTMKSETVVKNRRLGALKRLAVEGDYFTEQEMRKRNPLLYEQLVGKYLTEDEKKDKNSFSNTMKKEEGCKLSTLLMEQYERDQAKDLQKEQEDAEEEIESDCDSDLHSTEFEDDRVLKLWGESDIPANYIDVSERITEGEKRLLFEEFRSHMYRNFIGGKETDFDYSQVDTNTDYDDMDELDRDAQDKYFSSESPEEEDMMEVSTDDRESHDEEELPTRSSSADEDPLDSFMSQIQDYSNQNDLNTRMKNTVI